VTSTGALLLLAAFAAWLVLVAPVNRTVSEALASVPASVPDVWMRNRARWEYGHVVGFGLQLLGLCALLVAVIRDTPTTLPSGTRQSDADEFASACSTAPQNASRSSGFLDVIRFRSTTTSSSTHVAPAFSRSFRTDGHEVRRRPRTASASIRSCGP